MLKSRIKEKSSVFCFKALSVLHDSSLSQQQHLPAIFKSPTNNCPFFECGCYYSVIRRIGRILSRSGNGLGLLYFFVQIRGVTCVSVCTHGCRCSFVSSSISSSHR